MSVPDVDKPRSYVFVSYAFGDESYAQDIVKALEARGLRCWIAPRDLDPNERWGEQVDAAIRAARYFCGVLTKERALSPQELQIGDAASVPVVVVTMDERSAAAGRSPYLGRAPAVAWRGGRGADALARLIKGVPEDSARADRYAFISSTSDDRAFVERLTSALQVRELEFWDYGESPRDYQAPLTHELEQRIQRAHTVLCVLSDAWRDSLCEQEYLYAEELRKPIIVLQASPLVQPVPLRLIHRLRIDFSKDFDAGFAKLLSELQRP